MTVPDLPALTHSVPDRLYSLAERLAMAGQRFGLVRLKHQIKPLGWIHRFCLHRRARDWVLAAPATVFPPLPDSPRIAILLHVHYVDLWPDMQALLQATNVPFDLIVTTTGDAAAAALAVPLAQHFPAAILRVMPNLGRDVGPFVTLLADGTLANYDLVCKLHAKRSPHRRNGQRWREQVTSALAGRNASACVARFAADLHLGLLGPRAYRFGQARRIGTNYPWLVALGMRFGLGRQALSQKFFAGTMFWLRPAALAPLARDGGELLHLFEGETGQIDGTLAHALERAMPMIVAQHGYCVGTADT